jgi:nucleotide-binding universal stress UspA family protein
MKPKIRKVLVPLDGSAGSNTVLPTVSELARAEGAQVRLLHVAPSPAAVVAGDRVIAYADQEAARIEQEVLAYLKRAAAELSALEVEAAVRFGDPVEEIVREAESAGADLIALATHRRTGVSRLLKGSVAEQVERATAIPVLLVRYGEQVAA